MVNAHLNQKLVGGAQPACRIDLTRNDCVITENGAASPVPELSTAVVTAVPPAELSTSVVRETPSRAVVGLVTLSCRCQFTSGACSSTVCKTFKAMALSAEKVSYRRKIILSKARKIQAENSGLVFNP